MFRTFACADQQQTYIVCSCLKARIVSCLFCSIVDYIKKGGVYMASHELHVCATFSRSFFWTDLNLWPEDLAPGSVVLLSGCDDLMNAQQVKAMLEQFDHIKVGQEPSPPALLALLAVAAFACQHKVFAQHCLAKVQPRILA